MEAKPRFELPFLLPSLSWLLDAMWVLLNLKNAMESHDRIHAGHGDIERA
jgi:hypothetical protein